MAHTDRDHPRVRRFWDWHDNTCGCGCHEAERGDRLCRCVMTDPLCPRGERCIGPIASDWNRDQRRIERTILREQLRKVRNGRLDVDDLPAGDQKLYHRPYYW